MTQPLPDPEQKHEYCPTHGNPDDLLYSWPCPVATVPLDASEEEIDEEPSPEETCPYFIAEMHRRMKDVELGHYFRMIFPDDPDHPGGEDKRHYSQEYVNHLPVGEPTPMFDTEPLGGFQNACTRCPKDCEYCTWLADCAHDEECYVWSPS